MSEHTKEPWHNGTDIRQIESGDGTVICIVSGSVSNKSTVADARRIVACVNACAGMKDPEAEIYDLQAQCDGLLAALQMALADHMTEAYLHPLRDGTVEAIRCAIASAEKPPCD